jgi:hypothetical protein
MIHKFDLCNDGWRLYDAWTAAPDDEREARWREYVAHRNGCDECPDYEEVGNDKG